MRLALFPIVLCACASAPPTDAQVWHRDELRPGHHAAADDAENALLTRLASLEAEAPEETQVSVHGRTFSLGPMYLAASGRRCRRVAGAEASLACSDGASWHFAPNVFGARP